MEHGRGAQGASRPRREPSVQYPPPPSRLWSCYGRAGSLWGPGPSPAARPLAPAPRAACSVRWGAGAGCSQTQVRAGRAVSLVLGTRTRCACAVSVPRAAPSLALPGALVAVDPVSAPSAGRGHRAREPGGAACGSRLTQLPRKPGLAAVAAQRSDAVTAAGTVPAGRRGGKHDPGPRG